MVPVSNTVLFRSTSVNLDKRQLMFAAAYINLILQSKLT